MHRARAVHDKDHILYLVTKQHQYNFLLRLINTRFVWALPLVCNFSTLSVEIGQKVSVDWPKHGLRIHLKVPNNFSGEGVVVGPSLSLTPSYFLHLSLHLPPSSSSLHL